MKKQEEFQEEYCFVKEVVKGKPVAIRRILFRCIGFLAGAVVFGVIAALVFVHFLPIFEKQASSDARVVFKEDPPKAQIEGQEVDEEEPNVQENQNEKDVEKSQNVPSSDEQLLNAHELIFEQMNAIAMESMYCMVNVTGISNEEDWFYMMSEDVKYASGVVIADHEEAYYILTKQHAVSDMDRIMVTFYDESIADGHYILHDVNTGLAVLKVDKNELDAESKMQIKVATLGNSYQMQQGESVIAIGSPMGYSNSIMHGQLTSTTSIASAYDKEYNLFVMDMLGSDDGSGILINLSGEVIGVITQEFSKENHKNVITCLPISQLKSLITALSNNEKIPYLGVKGQDVTDEIMKQTGMPKGIYVSDVNLDSPALQSGIQKADVITKYNGKPIETMAQYSEHLSKEEPDDTVDITVMRKGADGYVEFTFQVTLGSQ